MTKCKTEYCANGSVTTSGDACDTCIGDAVDTGGACASALNNGCAADAPCNDYLTCSNPCQ